MKDVERCVGTARNQLVKLHDLAMDGRFDAREAIALLSSEFKAESDSLNTKNEQARRSWG